MLEIDDRPRRFKDFLLSRTEWVVTRPKRVALVLGILGLAMRYAWLNTLPLVAGDQGWATISRLKTYYPWPTIWDSTDGLGGINATFNSFRYPTYAIEGWMAHFGAHWWLIERVVFYIPDAILIPIAGWYIAREFVGRSRWSLLGALIFASSTYLLIESSSEVPLALGAAIGCFALVTFVRSLRQLSVKWAVITSLLMAIDSGVDIRPTFISALMMGLYFLVISLAEPTLKTVAKRLGISALSGSLYLLTQLFWLLPLAVYGTNSQLPIAKQPDFNIATLTHSFAGVIAWWTGANPAPYVEGILNPTFIVLPLVAFIVLLRKRLSPEVLWLALCAIIFAFLGKTNTAPFGGIYNWMFSHLPAFNLFREGSKFLYPVVAAYGVLIPISMKYLSEAVKVANSKISRIFLIVSQTSLLVTIVMLSTACIWSLLDGSLLATTAPTKEPASFVQLTNQLSKDHTPGQLLWFGGPVFRTKDGDLHSYNIASPTHPFDQLNGNTQSLIPAADDPFQNFCPVHSQPYCYVNSTLLPYLLGQTDTTYIVIPKGEAVGSLPGTATSGWLKQQVAKVYGEPYTLGSGATAIYVWHLQPKPKPMQVRAYSAIGLVNSGPWSLQSIIPGLNLLHVPAVYEQTYSEATLPSAPSSLPDAVRISPYTNGGVRLSKPERAVLLIKSKAQKVDVTVRGHNQTLSQIHDPSNSSNWGVYGPLALPKGYSSLTLATGNVPIGPVVQWSPLARTQLVSSVYQPVKVDLIPNQETITTPSPSPTHHWVALNIDYDKGWLLEGKRPTVLGGGLFNLYYQPKISSKTLTFKFLTHPSEMAGLAISILTSLTCVAFLLFRRHRNKVVRTKENESEFEEIDAIYIEGSLATRVAAMAISFLVATLLLQAYVYFGVPSKFPSLAISQDPYLLNTDFATVSILLLSVSILLRLGGPLTLALNRSFNFLPRAKRTRASIALTMASMLALSSCGTSPYQNGISALTTAQNAGQPSDTILGSNLEAARQAFVAKDPIACIQSYTAALSSFPNDASIYSGRSQCYDSQGVRLTDAALNDLRRANQLAPTNPNIEFQLAQSLQSVGDLTASESTYLHLAQLADSSSQLIRDAIDGLIQLHRFGAASTALKIELARFPNDPTSYLARSDLDIAQNNEIGALKSTQIAQTLSASNTISQANVNAYSCNLEIQRLQYQRAKASCQIALRDGLATSGVWENLAVIAADQGNFNRAISLMHSAIGAFVANVGPYAQPSGVTGFGLSNLIATEGEFYVEEGAIAKGISDFQLALKDLPPSAPDFQAVIEADIQSAQ